MIRALVNWGSANDDVTEVTPISNLTSFPNPFAGKTDISFNLNKAAKTNLNIYNLKGQLVRSLNSGFLAKGDHKVSWDGYDNQGLKVSPGIYFSKLETASKTLTHKIIRIQ
jgi:flagellar hook assembly protein FlgD